MKMFYTSLTLQDEYQALQLALTTAETSLSSVKRENDTLVVQLMALKVFFYSMSLGYISRGGAGGPLWDKGQIEQKRQVFQLFLILKRGNSDKYSHTFYTNYTKVLIFCPKTICFPQFSKQNHKNTKMFLKGRGGIIYSLHRLHPCL